MIEIFDDIRKIYRFSRPCEELAPYIEFFSESCADTTTLCFEGSAFSVKMFASYTPTVWFNLGPAYKLYLNGSIRSIKAGEDILVVRDGITERINQASDHIFTIKFFPGALQAVLGVSQQTMAGRVIALQQIWPGTLIERVKALPGFEERLQLVQQFLLSSTRQRIVPDHYVSLVRKTMAEYNAGGMQYNVGQAAEKGFVTSKTINRYFHRVIGTSPKQYLSIMRARLALTAYMRNRAAFSPVLYGYYDASHFHKEVVKFTGQRLGRLPE